LVALTTTSSRIAIGRMSDRDTVRAGPDPDRAPSVSKPLNEALDLVVARGQVADIELAGGVGRRLAGTSPAGDGDRHGHAAQPRSGREPSRTVLRYGCAKLLSMSGQAPKDQDECAECRHMHASQFTMPLRDRLP
jgi:hypothetical protein